MKTCETIQNDFIAFIENRLNDGTKVQIRNHIAKCSSCAGFMAELQLSFQIIDEQKYIDMSDSFFENIEKRIGKDQQRNDKPKISHYFLQSFSYAAVVAIGLFAGSLIIDLLTKNDMPAKNPITSDELYWNDLDQEPIESFLMSEKLF